jgi:hypothetical protein
MGGFKCLAISSDTYSGIVELLNGRQDGVGIQRWTRKRRHDALGWGGRGPRPHPRLLLRHLQSHRWGLCASCPLFGLGFELRELVDKESGGTSRCAAFKFATVVTGVGGMLGGGEREGKDASAWSKLSSLSSSSYSSRLVTSPVLNLGVVSSIIALSLRDTVSLYLQQTMNTINSVSYKWNTIQKH